MRRSVAAAVLLSALAVQAQVVIPNEADWKEAAPPPPPVLRTDGLVPLLVPGSTLRWGVDPASISIGQDRVVRYVIVAAGEGGAVTGLYEGVRCDAAQVKLYMRNNGGKWSPAQDEWKTLHGNGAVRHSLLIARQGACMGQGPNSSPQQIARDLAADGGNRFRNEVR